MILENPNLFSESKEQENHSTNGGLVNGNIESNYLISESKQDLVEKLREVEKENSSKEKSSQIEEIQEKYQQLLKRFAVEVKLETKLTAVEEQLYRVENSLASANRQLADKQQEINNLNDQLQTRDETIRKQRGQLDKLNAERIKFRGLETAWKGEIKKHKIEAEIEKNKADNLEKEKGKIY